MLHMLLNEFASEFDGALAEIRAAIAARDVELAHRFAHKLRGAAGSLSATQLERAAWALEEYFNRTSGGAEGIAGSIRARVGEGYGIDCQPLRHQYGLTNPPKSSFIIPIHYGGRLLYAILHSPQSLPLNQSLNINAANSFGARKDSSPFSHHRQIPYF